MSALPNAPHQHQATEAEMSAFLCERYWLPQSDYPHCSDVFRTLGISGSDCDDFMELFAATFNVDLADFVWPKFHLSESEAQDVRRVLRPFMRMAGLKTNPLNRDLVPISIEHLLAVARHGQWFDPVETGEAPARLSRGLTRFNARLRAGGVPKTLRR